MFSFGSKSRFYSFSVGTLLSLYLLVSYYSVLCSFHHLTDERVKKEHHHGSSKSIPASSASHSFDFCKFAQSISPVIHSVVSNIPVSIQPVAAAFLDAPSVASSGVVAGIYSRGPPLSITL
jgi:hypothetical protein